MIVRKARSAERTNAVLAAFGEATLGSANIIVVEEDGEIVGAAVGLAPVAGDTATLGEFRFARGDLLARFNREIFRALLKAHVEEAIGRGSRYGVSMTKNRVVRRMVERAFGIKSEPSGWEPNTDRATAWTFRVELVEFLAVL